MVRRRSLLAGAALMGVVVSVDGGALNSEVLKARILRLRFSMGFMNPHGRALTQQRIWCYLPASLEPSQHIVEVLAQVPVTTGKDRLGHNYLEAPFASVPPYGHIYLGLEAQVLMSGANGSIKGDEDWLKAERFIESDHPEIIALARQLRQPLARQTAKAIFEWVRLHLQYAGYIADDLGALFALTERRGDCTEYADLVVALARANGIPARMVGGYVVAGDTILRANDYHNWAELWIDGAWQIVDAQRGRFFPVGEGYLRFRLYRDVAINPLGLAHRYAIEGDLLPITT